MTSPPPRSPGRRGGGRLGRGAGLGGGLRGWRWSFGGGKIISGQRMRAVSAPPARQRRQEGVKGRSGAGRCDSPEIKLFPSAGSCLLRHSAGRAAATPRYHQRHHQRHRRDARPLPRTRCGALSPPPRLPLRGQRTGTGPGGWRRARCLSRYHRARGVTLHRAGRRGRGFGCGGLDAGVLRGGGSGCAGVRGCGVEL